MPLWSDVTSIESEPLESCFNRHCGVSPHGTVFAMSPIASAFSPLDVCMPLSTFMSQKPAESNRSGSKLATGLHRHPFSRGATHTDAAVWSRRRYLELETHPIARVGREPGDLTLVVHRQVVAVVDSRDAEPVSRRCQGLRESSGIGPELVENVFPDGIIRKAGDPALAALPEIEAYRHGIVAGASTQNAQDHASPDR